MSDIPPPFPGGPTAHEAPMTRLLLSPAACLILTAATGCGDSAPTPPARSDPHIRVKESVGGGVGPVGGGRGREYEGPASQAPD
jgi:hypothetical protein